MAVKITRSMKRKIVSKLKDNIKGKHEKKNNNSGGNSDNNSEEKALLLAELLTEHKTRPTSTVFGVVGDDFSDFYKAENNNTPDNLLKKSKEYQYRAQHTLFSDLENHKRYMDQKDYEFVKSVYGNGGDLNKIYSPENASRLNDIYNKATILKPKVDQYETPLNSSVTASGKQVNLNTSVKPKVSGYIRWPLDLKADKKVEMTRDYKYWISDEVPLIIDGVGEIATAQGSD